MKNTLLLVLFILVLAASFIVHPLVRGQTIEVVEKEIDPNIVFADAIFDKIAEDKEPVITEEGDKLVMRELPYYHFVAEKDVSDGIAYESESKSLFLKPVKIEYDTGTPFKPSTEPTDVIKHPEHIDFGMLVEGRPGKNAVGVYYPDAFGPGNNIGVLTHKYKIKEVESINVMPVIPKDAQSLDIWFEINGDLLFNWDYEKEFEIIEPVRLGNNSWLRPAQVWDSRYTWNEAYQTYDENRVTVPSYFKVQNGRYYYVKSIPVAWLSAAQYPIYTDADISWGADDEFYSDEIGRPHICRLYNSTTKFGVSFTNGVSTALRVVIGEYDGGTGIDWGSVSDPGITLYNWVAHDISSPSEDIIVIAFNDSGEDLELKAAEISGRTVNSWGANAQVFSSGSRFESTVVLCDADEVMVFIRKTDASDHLYGGHASLSGSPKTTITVNDSRVLATTEFQLPVATEIDTDKALVLGRNNTLGGCRAVVISWNGSVLSAGSVLNWDSADAQKKYVYDAASPFLNFGETDKAACIYREYSPLNLKVAAFTIAGTTVTAGTDQTLTTGTQPVQSGLTFTGTTNFVAFFADKTDSSKLKSNLAEVNWTTRAITLGSDEEVDSDANSYAEITYLQTERVVGVYQRDTDTSGQARIGSLPSAASGTPTVVTVSITNVGTSTALGTGNITAVGGGTPSERGFCYITGSGTPDYSDTLTSEVWSSGTGTYSLTISSLSCGTYYSVRAYAATTTGTGYGETLNFATVPGSGCYGTDVLFLEFEPDQISSGTISDQSSQYNNVFYTISLSGSLSASYAGGLEPTGETSSIPGDSDDLVGALQPPDNMNPSEETMEAENNPLYAIINALHILTEEAGAPIDVKLLWIFSYIVMTAITLIALDRKLGKDWITAVSVVFIAILYWLWGPIPFWLVMIEGAVALYIIGKSVKVGSLT